MKLSISNIAWSTEHDEEIYAFLRDNSFDGLEIAPTRIFSDMPYENIDLTKNFVCNLKNTYGLVIPSIQSIWYGVSESIFGSDADRQKLFDYTHQAIEFSSALGCPNLVFGCPKNRLIPSDLDSDTYLSIAEGFFYEVGKYAALHNVFISIEPNPPIYGTNFINATSEAFEICKRVNSPGIKVNLDLGTIIYNSESLDILSDNIHMINHIHISEPYLAPIEKRTLHSELIKILHELEYDRFLSIEMRNHDDIELVKKAILYIKNIVN
jgi:sugar phosphate isomerase/epimerase